MSSPVRRFAAVLATCLIIPTVVLAADIDPDQLGQAKRPVEVDEDAAKAFAGTALGGSLLCLVVSILGALVLNFMPAIIAALRKHPNTLPIFLLVLLLGWTGVGWIIALVWSLTSPSHGTVIVKQNTVVNQNTKRPKGRKKRRRDEDDEDDEDDHDEDD